MKSHKILTDTNPDVFTGKPYKNFQRLVQLEIFTQPINSTHSNIKRKAYMFTMRCPQEQPESKNYQKPPQKTKHTQKKQIPIYWRMLNKLSFIHTIECEK